MFSKLNEQIYLRFSEIITPSDLPKYPLQCTNSCKNLFLEWDRASYGMTMQVYNVYRESSDWDYVKCHVRPRTFTHILTKQ